MRYYYFWLSFLLLNGNPIKAQHTKFISAGKIEFERKIKLSALYASNDPVLTEFEKSGLYFKKSFFTLLFDTTHTTYMPGKENPENFKFQKLPAEENIVYIDPVKNLVRLQKKIFDYVFIVSDTIKKIQWKITDEKREIAGFLCKRANAIIMDSVYTVAYFTEEILVESGPESFTGLPGMILGVAIPREHITWFANSVSVINKNSPIDIPQKGTTISSEGLKDFLKEHFKSLGIGNWYYKFALL